MGPSAVTAVEHLLNRRWPDVARGGSGDSPKASLGATEVRRILSE